MFKGFVCAISACFIWGLIFVIPQFINGFSALEIVLGRYFFYGIISTAIFFKTKNWDNYPLKIWIKALYFSFASTVGYYICVIYAMRQASPAICAIIAGISPITIAFYGNWKHKEGNAKSLLIPSLLIIFGLTIINIPHLEITNSPISYLLGLTCSFLALSSWSWYVIANSDFLKKNPQVTSSDWSTLIGVATLIWVAIFAFFFTLFDQSFTFDKYFVFNTNLATFLIGSAILGLFCSWLAHFLWNKASIYLPVSVAGQITIFETIFGVIFVYVFTQSYPPLFETIGLFILLSSVIFGIRQFSKRKLSRII